MLRGVGWALAAHGIGSMQSAAPTGAAHFGGAGLNLSGRSHDTGGDDQEILAWSDRAGSNLQENPMRTSILLSVAAAIAVAATALPTPAAAGK